MALGRTNLRIALGAALLLIGVGLIFLWGAFAAMYVPQCSTFGLDARDGRCRNPVLWMYAGYLLAAVGGLLLGYEVFRRLRRAS